MKQKTILLFVIALLLNVVMYAQNQRKPLQIADQFALNLTATNQYFHNSETGVVYTKTFTNKGSAYIKLHINSFDLSPGDFVRVSSRNGEEYIYSEKGKIVGEHKEMISEFWTGTIWSDQITIALHSKGNNKNHYGFNIDRVAYGHSAERINKAVKLLDSGNPQESICSIDNKEAIVCYDGTEMGRKAKAVCRLLIGGGGLCTGWLLGCDGNVMTNNHCIGSASDANNTDFLFNYQYDNCAGTVNATSDLQATSSTFIQTDGALDFTLVKLPVNPTNIYGYLSLSSTIASVGERIYIPQHPGGRRKEIAVNTDIGGDANGFAMVTGVGGGGARVTYQCDTEGGSSGSPVIRYSDNLVVAIHNTGGCPNGSNGRSDEMITAIAGNMPPCGVDDNNPSAPFVTALVNTVQSIDEATNCSYQDIDLTIRIATAASQNADVTLSVTGGTATDLNDFELITSNITFLAGDDTNKTATLRIYNDAFVEGDENIIISLALNANGGDAQLGTISEFNLTILDDDYNPNIGGVTTFYSNDFEGNLADFTITGNGTSNFVIGNSAAANSTDFDTSSNLTNFAFVNDDACDCTMDDERMTITNPFDFSTVSQAFVTFDFTLNDTNDTWDNDAYLQVSTDNGASWTNIGPEFEVASWETKVVDLSAYAGQSNILISFSYSDQGTWAYGLAIDNLSVTGLGNAAIQSIVNTGSATTLSLKNSGTINAYDTTNGNIMAAITNIDDLDFGCTSIEVSRAGNSAQTYNGSVAPALVLDKTFTITPATNNPSSNNTIAFYFTETELQGWETATGNTRNNLGILKNDGANTENAPSTLTAFGSGFKLEGSFTSGMNGTYYFGDINVLATNDFNFSNGFSIYPNPVTNELNITFNQNNTLTTVSVHNMLGQVIFTKEISSKNDLRINTSKLSNGMYFITINTESATQTFKFLKK
ncbi:MAG: trypsin-like peptidase domain-containing protein [Flavobacteriaceae bacterium]|nr:trypsin-like peptidase domain-containing protein [Flavobacteriaceae bacterium]